MKKILRVFIKKTSHTPIDDYVRIGMPDMFMPKDISEVHISTVFTWDKQKATILKKNYQAVLPNVPVKVGGPAYCSYAGNLHLVNTQNKGLP